MAQAEFPLVEYMTEWEMADGGGKFNWPATFDLRHVVFAKKMFDITQIRLAGESELRFIKADYDDFVRDWSLASRIGK